LSDFLHGAITMASATVAIFFLRYWRSTRDRLLLIFSVAFALMATQWLLVTALPGSVTIAHLLRFAAFLLIALAVLDKNRNREKTR